MNEKELLFLTRRKKKIKLKDIAENIKCSVGLLSMFENNKANISDEKYILYKRYIEKY